MPIWDTGAEGIYYLFPPPQFSLTVNVQPSVRERALSLHVKSGLQCRLSSTMITMRRKITEGLACTVHFPWD